MKQYVLIMKKLIKSTALGILSIATFSCNLKTSDQAELEKLRALEAQRNAMQSVNVAQPQSDIDFESPNYEPSEPVAYRPEKKKMSAATKGALIGAGAGAASGAVIAKKPVKGAVLGGVIGAGAGAVTGSIIDKKKKQ